MVIEGALLGNWKVSKGQKMRCHHEKEVLVWETLITLPWQPEYSYRYVLVDGTDESGDPKIDKTEMCNHTLVLPPGLRHDDIVEVRSATLECLVKEVFPSVHVIH